ncbi:OLC1v1037302C1 [Oldenlandia corymbosa var. corymbosa]|nr:OLC1v1037302C1 [Oldenlandia corymbosa var. corymbosa]
MHECADHGGYWNSKIAGLPEKKINIDFCYKETINRQEMWCCEFNGQKHIPCWIDRGLCRDNCFHTPPQSVKAEAFLP